MADTLIRLDSFPFDSKFDGYDEQGYPVYDRAVGSKYLRAALREFFSDGVFPSSEGAFTMSAGSSGLTVNVSAGMAIIDGGIGGTTSSTSIRVADSPTEGNAAYAIFVRLDDNSEYRSLYFRVEKGEPGANPQPPEPDTSEAVKELRIGYVVIPTNATSMANAVFYDNRGDSVCPYAAPFERIDIGEILSNVRQEAQHQLALAEAEIDGYTEAFQGDAISELAKYKRFIDANIETIEELVQGRAGEALTQIRLLWEKFDTQEFLGDSRMVDYATGGDATDGVDLDYPTGDELVSSSNLAAVTREFGRTLRTSRSYTTTNTTTVVKHTRNKVEHELDLTITLGESDSARPRSDYLDLGQVGVMDDTAAFASGRVYAQDADPTNINARCNPVGDVIVNADGQTMMMNVDGLANRVYKAKLFWFVPTHEVQHIGTGHSSFTLQELEWVADDLYMNGEDSEFFVEVKRQTVDVQLNTSSTYISNMATLFNDDGITAVGATLSFRVQNVLTDNLTGGGKAALTLVSRDVLPIADRLNPESALWGDSELRASMNGGEIYGAMPPTLQRLAKKVDKKTYLNWDGQQEYVVTSDKFWVPALSEIMPNLQQSWVPNEGEAYLVPHSTYNGSTGGSTYQLNRCTTIDGSNIVQSLVPRMRNGGEAGTAVRLRTDARGMNADGGLIASLSSSSYVSLNVCFCI